MGSLHASLPVDEEEYFESSLEEAVEEGQGDERETRRRQVVVAIRIRVEAG